MTEQMTPLETAARQEAERRYGHPDADYEDRIENTAARDAFEAGVLWGAEQADAEVRRLTAALAEANDEAQQFDADRFVERARAERAEAALTKALGQRDAVAVTAERMTSYARQAEGERDEARAEVESLERAAQVTDASWREHVERAEKAEAVVARVRALLDRPLIPSALLRDALDGAGMGERE